MSYDLCYAQNNLVPNPSFEDTVVCPDILGQFTCKNWYSPSNNTPDYYNNCGSSAQTGTPINLTGFQVPNSGVSYAGIAIFGHPSFGPGCEYIAVKLEEELLKDSLYYLEFFISLSNYVEYGNSDFGVYFSIDSIYEPTWVINAVLPFNPQIEYQHNYIMINDTVNWTKINGYYFASGGEKYIAIGNFNPHDSSYFDTIYPTNNWYLTYYYIDDVYLGLVEDTSISGISLYPNPNNGYFTLNYNLGEGDNGFAEIYNSIGQKVYQRELSHNNGIENFELSLSAGCYLIQIVSGEVVLRNEKLIIVR